MSEEIIEDHKANRLAKNRFVLLIAGTITISLVLVFVAMLMYLTSGAAQVDLSRPGYSSVRDQVEKTDDEFKTFPATGPIDSKTLSDFEAQYKKELEQIKTEVFQPSALTDETLSIQPNELSQ